MRFFHGERKEREICFFIARLIWVSIKKRLALQATLNNRMGGALGYGIDEKPQRTKLLLPEMRAGP